MKILQDAAASVSFISILPLFRGDWSTVNKKNLVAFFPLTGIIIAALLFALHFAVPKKIFPVLGLTTWILVTGGFHLDGLSDSLDALAFGKSPNERLKIMKDSRIGCYGAISLFIVLSAKLLSLGGLSVKNVMLAPVWGRVSLVAISFFGKAAKPEGLGTFVKENTSKRELLIAAGIAFLFSAGIGKAKEGLFCLMLTLIFSILFSRFWNKKTGGFTGDILGAGCELTETLILILFLGR